MTEPFDPVDVVEKVETDDTLEIEWITDKEIVTEDEVWEHHKLDRAIWRITEIRTSAWQVPMKVSRGQAKDKSWKPEVAVKRQLSKIACKFERLLPKPFEIAHKALFDGMRAKAAKYPDLPKPRLTRASHMLEIDLFDAHFGKLAWSPQCGQDYDLKLAESIYRNAVRDLLALASNFRVDKIVIPIGNDFFHIDNAKNETTAGTRVDTDGRIEKITEIGNKAVVWAIETAAKRAPVEVIRIPGNHDRLASMYLANYISAYYHGCTRVSVDTDPASRKYLRFGRCLTGYIHSDGIRLPELPLLMATERPSEWASTVHHEWRTGHTHKSKKLTSVDVDTYKGCTVRALMSLSAVDVWHYDNLFVGGRRAAEAFLISRERGYVANFCADARP